MALTLRSFNDNRRLRIIGITYAQSVVALGGVVFLLAGGYTWCLKWPNVTAALIGIGTSLLATLITSVVFNTRDSLLDGLVDYGLVRVWSDRKGRQPADQQPINWVGEVRRANEQCTLLGVSLSGFSIDDREEFASVAMALTGRVDFTIMLLNPKSQVAQLRAEEEKQFREDTQGRIRQALTAFWAIREMLPEERRKRFKIYLYSEVPTFSLVWVDRYMIVTHYLPATRNANSPAYALWDLRPFKPHEKMLYAIFERNINAIINSPRTVSITAANVAEYGSRDQGNDV